MTGPRPRTSSPRPSPGREASTYLTRDGTATFLGRPEMRGPETRLAVRVGPRGPHPSCTGAADLGRDERCLDGDLLVTASGAEALAILPGVEITATGAEPPARQIPVALADGTQVVVTTPGGAFWPMYSASARVAVVGIGGGDVDVQLVPETAWGTAVLDESTLEPVGVDQYLRTHPDGARSVLVERDGWTADVPLRDAPDDVVDRLVASLEIEVTEAGVIEIGADGLEVVGAAAVLSPMAFPSIITGDRLFLEVGQPCTGGPGRCFGDGRLRITAGDEAQAVLDGITAEVSPPR